MNATKTIEFHLLRTLYSTTPISHVEMTCWANREPLFRHHPICHCGSNNQMGSCQPVQKRDNTIQSFGVSLPSAIHPLHTNSWGTHTHQRSQGAAKLLQKAHFARVLNSVGIPFNIAFGIYLILYYLCGAIGFYCLATKIFKDKLFAYLGYITCLW